MRDITRAHRDLRLISIGGGADEVMLGIISKLMGMASGSPERNRLIKSYMPTT